MTPASPLIEVHAVGKSFPGTVALHDVSLTLETGRVHALCGENGAGKSTLMRILAGVHPSGSYTGEVRLDGRPLRLSSVRDAEDHGIGAIHQELALVPALSVAENVLLGREPRRHGLVDRAAGLRRTAELLDRVGLRADPRTPVSSLRIGQQQLVEIARALSRGVRLLILDEPTAALGEDDSAHLLDLVRRLRDDGVTPLLVSHRLPEVCAVAERVTVLRDGRVVASLEGSPQAPVDEDALVTAMAGTAPDLRYPARERVVGAPALQVRDWSVRAADSGRPVVEGVSLRLHRGEIVGLAGLMGAGRTTLAASLFGHAPGLRTSGTLLKDGGRIVVRRPRDAIRHGIAYATEDRAHLGLNLHDDVKHNIGAAVLDRVSRHGVVLREQERANAERLRRDLTIRVPHVDAAVRDLSGGNQQKVALARWLLTSPDVLILDEPTRGVDVRARTEIYRAVGELAAAGTAVLLISSELSELIGLCDRIYTLREGRLTGEAAAAEASRELLLRRMTPTGGRDA